MSYANVAGLDYRFGLYSSFATLLVYSVTGTSRQLAGGPVALVSLLLETGLREAMDKQTCPAYFQQDNETSPYFIGVNKSKDDWLQQYDFCPNEYEQLAFAVALFTGADGTPGGHTAMCMGGCRPPEPILTPRPHVLAGLILLCAGLLQLGFIVAFLSHPVISGFTSGAAITIGLSQVQYLVGYTIPKSQYLYIMLPNIFTTIFWKTDWKVLLLGLCWAQLEKSGVAGATLELVVALEQMVQTALFQR